MENDGACNMNRQNIKCSCARKSGRRKNNAGTDKEGGPGGSSGKAFSYRLDGPSSIPGVGGMEIFFSLLRVQSGSGVDSTFYKMSTGEFSLG